MPVWRLCPLCGSVNSEQAALCECGFDFRKGRKPNPACPDLPERIAEWKLEPELAGPVPRRVVLRWGYVATPVLAVDIFLGLAVLFFGTEYAVFAWLSLILLGLIALLYFAERRELRLSKLLVSGGTATRGIVVERKWTFAHRAADSYPLYVIAYDALARRDISVVVVFPNPWGFNGGKVGDTLTVLYLPEAPEKAMLYKDCHYKARVPQEERSA